MRMTAKRILTAIVVVAVTLYFLLDAAFFSLIKPFVIWVGRLPFVLRVGTSIGSLGAYATLALFLVPIVVLEPAKPIGLYLIGTGHAVSGALLITIGELLKIILVERLFVVSRAKLMSIRWFAWGFNITAGWLADLRGLRLWQKTLMRINVINNIMRPYAHLWRFQTQGRPKPLVSRYRSNQRSASEIDDP